LQTTFVRIFAGELVILKRLVDVGRQSRRNFIVKGRDSGLDVEMSSNASPLNRKVQRLELELKEMSTKLEIVYDFVNKLFGNRAVRYD
jgi:hypothetical protein